MPLSASQHRSATPASVCTPAVQKPSLGARRGSANTHSEPVQQRPFSPEAPSSRAPSAGETRGEARGEARAAPRERPPVPGPPRPPRRRPATCAVVRALQVPLHAGGRAGRDVPLGGGLCRGVPIQRGGGGRAVGRGGRRGRLGQRQRRERLLHGGGGGAGRAPTCLPPPPPLARAPAPRPPSPSSRESRAAISAPGGGGHRPGRARHRRSSCPAAPHGFSPPCHAVPPRPARR